MNDITLAEMAEQIADAIARRPVIPASAQLWDADAVASYLTVTRRAVLERYAPLPSFPAAIRIPLADGKLARPRWKAVEVMAWVERHKDRPTSKARQGSAK
jgi:hypothetical protein